MGGRHLLPSPASWFHCRHRQRREVQTSLVLLSTGEHSSPSTDTGLLLPEARSPGLASSPPEPTPAPHTCTVCAARILTSLGGKMEELEVNSSPKRTTERQGGLPSCSCQKYCCFPERSRAQLSDCQARGAGAGSEGGARRERHPWEEGSPCGRVNTVALPSGRPLSGHSFSPTVVVSWGRSHPGPLSQGHFFKKEKEMETLGPRGRSTKPK